MAGHGDGVQTEYSSYRLGMSKKRASWLSTCLNAKVAAGKVSAKEMQQGLGKLGFAAIALDWERPFLGPAIQAKSGLLIILTMLRVLMRWLADKLDTGDRLQRPVILTAGLPPLSFFTDAKAESDRAWIAIEGSFARNEVSFAIVARQERLHLTVPELR